MSTAARARLARFGGWLLVGTLLAPAGVAAQSTRPAPAKPPAAAPRSAAPAPGARKGEERTQPVTVDADRMERFGKESLVIFTGNVIARQDNSVQYTDRMEVYLDEKGDRILRTVSKGNVRIVTKDCKTGTARRAEYFELQKLMKLIGDARVWDRDNNVVTGDTIDIYLSEDRSVVQGGAQGRVKAQFFPREESEGASAAPRPAAPCPS
jgi:lipopolysaccharide export system protein LptA